jgi:hypothetical protein
MMKTKTAKPPRCRICNGPTHIWDRRTGERVCIDCTFVRPVNIRPPTPAQPVARAAQVVTSKKMTNPAQLARHPERSS